VRERDLAGHDLVVVGHVGRGVLAAPAVGRISPDGKRAVVAALADANRYVAMLGDGVNDVPR
jgi:P-type E1-E2 ATPase